ncbi:MAG: GntR family transcriptional regulator [Myxococcota bacterium]|jgi:GntR family transcriptional repressor for pyruvate dehydrogenase complex|nr:GntR family transcriptional regulator [Myxococcota bacterium]
MSSSQRIFEALRVEILSGDLAPGDRLPPERTLAELHDTNRNTLREALRKLEQIGLVGVRQGQGVTVQDFRQAGTLELLTPFLLEGGDIAERVAVVVDLLHARRHVLQTTIRLVAERRTDEDMVRLEALAEGQVRAAAAGDRQAVVRGDIALIDAFFDAAHSLTFRWIANSLLTVAREMVERFPALWVEDATYPTVVRTLVEAIGEQDGDRAAETLMAYYTKTDLVLVDQLRRVAGRALAVKAMRGASG